MVRGVIVSIFDYFRRLAGSVSDWVLLGMFIFLILGTLYIIFKYMQARFKSGKKPVTLSFRQYQEREKHVVNKDILYQGNDFNDALDVVEENSVDRIPIVISEDLISSEVRFEE